MSNESHFSEIQIYPVLSHSAGKINFPDTLLSLISKAYKLISLTILGWLRMEEVPSIYKENNSTITPTLLLFHLTQANSQWCPFGKIDKFANFPFFLQMFGSSLKNCHMLDFLTILHLCKNLSKSEPTTNQSLSPKWLHLCDCLRNQNLRSSQP